MDFKIDENLPESITHRLCDAGHDAVSVRQQELAGAADDRLLDVCRQEGRALLPDRHPFLAAVRAAGGRPRRTVAKRFMILPLDDACPIPDDTFYWSILDNV